jgi:Cu(I)/Ag(I) efflux system membrane protein CusA/SilA
MLLERLIETCARNWLLVVLVALLIVGLGAWALYTTPVDVLPDLSDVQVIVQTEFEGQGPQIVEDQVTYPLATALLAVPHAKTVRGFSMFGTSMVYVVFEDGTDLYWARSRVLERLSVVQGRLPANAQPQLGPDATGVGWVYQYSLVDRSGRQDLSQLRALQDFFLRYELQALDGVAEVASVGGFQKEYQVVVDPQRLAAYGLTLDDLGTAIRNANRDVGGRVLELGGREFIVRSRGYLQGADDLRQVPVKSSGGTRVTVGDVARIQLGPELRRGLTEKDGTGEVVSGIVVMRYGENAQAVIARVKTRLEELRASLPPGVEVVPEYDRSILIGEAIDTMQGKLRDEMLVVALVVILFLLHVRSAFVALITVPTGLLVALLAMKLLGINANIMSLGGIAIAIGVMVDASLVMVENAHKHLERSRGDGREGEENSPLPSTIESIRNPQSAIRNRINPQSDFEVVVAAAKEVGPSLFFSLLIVTISFLPVFTLEEIEGRLFRPLALTKTFAMAAASLLSVTLVPALMGIFVRGRIRPEARNPLARFFMALYRPVIRTVLAHPLPVLVAGVALLLLTLLPVQTLLFGRTLVPFPQVGSEFMPALNEGDLFYMPVTLPDVSVQQAKTLLQQTNRILMSFPEVASVLGKAGRAETATDPAPLSMFETIVRLKPEAQWRPGQTRATLIAEMNAALALPGVTNMWTMPIRARTDMLATGIRTPVGVKITGPSLRVLDSLAVRIEAALGPVAGTRAVFAERALGGQFLDIVLKREEAARLGLNTGAIQDALAAAIGGMTVTTTVEGLERYAVTLRYPRALRDNLPALRAVLIPLPGGGQVPLGQVADLRLTQGPTMVRSEDARPNSQVLVDVAEGTDLGTYVQQARQAVALQVALPPGYALRWSGQFEYLERTRNRLQVLIPLTLLLIFLLLYLHFRSVTEALLLMIPLPFAVVGAVWLLWLLGYEMSVAVGVGLIGVAGLAAETGVVMHVYLDEAMRRYRREGRLHTPQDLRQALAEGAVDRLRPKLMTVLTTLIGLLPVMVGTEVGTEVMKRIATPMVGGLVTSTLHTLVMIPALYALVHGLRLRRARQAAG